MKVLSIDKIKVPVVMTLGSFDGIHLGHKTLLEMIINYSKKYAASSLIISFDPHPRKILRPDQKVNLLTNFDEKTEIFSKLGIDIFSLINFNSDIASMSYSEFYENIIFKNLDIKHIITGFNHSFGKNREGNFDHLNELCSKYGIDITSVGPQYYKGINISSTRIRESILKGSLKEANEMLGHVYFLKGHVVSGKKLGNKLGFPTANIQIKHPDKTIPQKGVYFTKTVVNGDTYFSMTNIGHNPTFGETDISIESHIFDFHGDIYSKDIKVCFISRIRDEIKFNSVKDLVKQLLVDRDKCIDLINDLPVNPCIFC